MQVPSSQGSTSSEPREPGPRPPIHGVKAPRLLLARKVGEAPPEFQHLRAFGKCVGNVIFWLQRIRDPGFCSDYKYKFSGFCSSQNAHQHQGSREIDGSTFSFELRFWHNFVPDMHDFSEK